MDLDLSALLDFDGPDILRDNVNFLPSSEEIKDVTLQETNQQGQGNERSTPSLANTTLPFSLPSITPLLASATQYQQHVHNQNYIRAQHEHIQPAHTQPLPPQVLGTPAPISNSADALQTQQQLKQLQQMLVQQQRQLHSTTPIDPQQRSSTAFASSSSSNQPWFLIPTSGAPALEMTDTSVKREEPPPMASQSSQPSQQRTCSSLEVASSLVPSNSHQESAASKNSGEEEMKDSESKGSYRKHKHRHTEKMRRERIKSALNQIQQLVHCRNVDKATILNTAVKELRQKDDLEKEVHRLEDENAKLKHKLEQAKRESQNQRVAPELSAASSMFVDAFLSNATAMCVAGLDMKIVDMNERFAQLIGATREHYQSNQLSCLSLSPLSDFHKLFGAMQRLTSGEQGSTSLVKRMKTLDGREFSVLTTLIVVKEGNAPKYLFSMVVPLDEVPNGGLQAAAASHGQVTGAPILNISEASADMRM